MINNYFPEAECRNTKIKVKGISGNNTTLLNDKQDTETQYNKTCHKRFIGHETKENMT